jgi:hypothetical protein
MEIEEKGVLEFWSVGVMSSGSRPEFIYLDLTNSIMLI